MGKRLERRNNSEMDIEVNEYVRTNKGNIGKVVEIRLGFNKDT